MKKWVMLLVLSVLPLSLMACEAPSTENNEVSPTVTLNGDWLGFGYEVTESDDSVLVAYRDIPGDWWTVNAQFMIPSVDSSRGSVMFTFIGVKDHSYAFKIEGEEVAKEESIVANGDEQTVTLDLASFTEAERASMDLLVVFVQTPGVEGNLEMVSVAYGNVKAGAEPVVQTPSLTTPFGVLVQFETEVAWGAIPEAQSFDVFVEGVEGSPFNVEAGFFAYNLDYLNLPKGMYIIQIRANGDGENILDSELSYPIIHLVNFDPGTPGEGSPGADILPTPFGLVIENGELMWGSILEAASFEVYIEGVDASPFTVPAGFFALRLDALNLDSKIYIIQVKAIGDTVNYVDSLLTTPIVYVVE